MKRALLLTLGLLLLASPAAADASLRFVRDGKPVKTLSSDALAAACGAETVTVEDPYYGRTKRYRACPLVRVLELGLGQPPSALAGETVFFRARDGYVRPAQGEILLEPGGWLAFADADLPPGRWQPIDRGKKDPAPFYVVWTGAAQRDPERHPWPYALAEIAVAPFEETYPHTVPAGVPEDDPAWQGYALFQRACFACHAVNGEGGTVGPELNVPRSIVEYRPEEQIKAYVRNPQSFRYTSMPAHRDLTDAQLEALVAYFRAMSQRKHDPHPARMQPSDAPGG